MPGATAFTTALIYSGLDTSKFLFRGFFPRENRERLELIEDLKLRTETIIVYESPYRILDSLQFIKNNLGNRNMAVCRELTKLHEEIIRGTAEQCINYFTDKSPRGEFVLVISGKTLEEIEKEKSSLWEDLTIEQHIVKFVNEGLSKKDAIKRVAKERGVAKSEIYKYSTEI